MDMTKQEICLLIGVIGVTANDDNVLDELDIDTNTNNDILREVTVLQRLPKKELAQFYKALIKKLEKGLKEA